MPFMKTLIPIIEGSILVTYSPSKASPPNTSSWAIRFQHLNFGGRQGGDGHTYLVYSNCAEC